MSDPTTESPSQKLKGITLGGFGHLLDEKEQKNLLFYVAIGIVLVELAITVVAIAYAISTGEQTPGGMIRFRFPWMAYLVSVVVVPALIMLIVHMIGMSFSRNLHGDTTPEPEVDERVPEKLRALYSLIRGAPTVILLIGLVGVGLVLYYVDGVVSMLLRIGNSVETIAPWVTGGLVVAWCVGYVGRMWFLYRTRRMEEEYAYRRDVLERTGLIILDSGRPMLPSEAAATQGVHQIAPQLAIDVSSAPAGTAPAAHADIVDADIVDPASDDAPRQNTTPSAAADVSTATVTTAADTEPTATPAPPKSSPPQA